jgi:16S rRNA (cytosine1402-N4)-methyltransferase
MEYKHTSVLLEEAIAGLNVKPGGTYVDGTLGGGGHAEEICKKLNDDACFIGIDRDRDALAAAEKRLEKYSCRKHFVHSNYADIKKVLKELGTENIDGALLDLGVSSFQLDNADRGFSYMQDAPLDMRMDRDDGFSAWDVVNGYSEEELSRIIKEYGEERWAKRIAKFIVEERKSGDIDSSAELVKVIKAAIPAQARRDGPHPAKRTFQAIRIEVNDEIKLLRQALEDFCDVLADKGRLCVITFHSLEDRIAKEVINRRNDPCTCPPGIPECVCGKVADMKKINRKPITAGEREVEDNPRSRSAKLRIAEKYRRGSR